MRKKIKQYTAVLLTVTMSLPGTMAYGNVDSLDAASGVVDASGYLKASTSNAQQTIHIASPSDADEDEEELIDDRMQNLTGKMYLQKSTTLSGRTRKNI